jgi:hypothetical protein
MRTGHYSFEAANPRHATNIVEHPELVAERIVRLAKIVGRERYGRSGLWLRPEPIRPLRAPDHYVGEVKVVSRRCADRDAGVVGQAGRRIRTAGS